MLRFRDVLPGSRVKNAVLRIQKQLQNRGTKKIVFLPFFVALNITKCKKLFNFELVKKKIWAIYKEL
jgi:hypothetical protein